MLESGITRIQRSLIVSLNKFVFLLEFKIIIMTIKEISIVFNCGGITQFLKCYFSFVILLDSLSRLGKCIANDSTNNAYAERPNSKLSSEITLTDCTANT